MKKQRKYRLVTRTEEAVDRLYNDGNLVVERDPEKKLVRLIPTKDWRQREGRVS